MDTDTTHNSVSKHQYMTSSLSLWGHFEASWVCLTCETWEVHSGTLNCQHGNVSCCWRMFSQCTMSLTLTPLWLCCSECAQLKQKRLISPKDTAEKGKL